MKKLWTVVPLAVLVDACCGARTGQLTGRWVAVAGSSAGTAPPASACVAGQAVGIAAPPSSGEPLGLRPSTDCFDETTLKEQFGDECAKTESEAAGSAVMTGDAPTGNTPTPGDVHWFCDKKTVVRVVLDRCEAPRDAQFRIRQIALSVEKQ